MTKILPTPYKKGLRYTTSSGIDLKVIAKAENYLMVRYIGRLPFIVHVKQFPGFLFKIGARII